MDIQIVLKSFIGFLIVFIIQLFARSKNYVLAALVPLFPSMAIFAYYFVSEEQGLDKLHETIYFGMVSLITYLCFLIALLFFTKHFKIVFALLLSSGIWFICAIIQTSLWSYFKKP